MNDDPLGPGGNASAENAQAEAITALQTMLKNAEQAQRDEAARAQLEGTVGARNDAQPASDTFFGMTAGALFAGLIISTVGIGMVRYAKVMGQPLYFVFGALLFVVPFVITDAIWLTVAGVVLVAVPMLLKKFLYW